MNTLAVTNPARPGPRAAPRAANLQYEALLREPANFTAADRVVAIPASGLGPTGLAVGVFEPDGPARAVLVFYHGGGAHRAAYGGMADRIRRIAPIAVLTPDLRGHGGSGGARGFAATPEGVWADVDLTVAWARRAYPGAAVFVGGHSSGAGMTVNWASHRADAAADIAGLVLLAPMLTARPNGFAQARPWVFMAYRLSAGRLMARAAAVRFAYPPGEAAARGLVEAYSPGMSLAVTPRDARRALGRIAPPVLMLAAAEDELSDAEATRAVAGRSTFDVVAGSHLSCLLPAALPLARFIAAAWAGPSDEGDHSK